MKKTDKVLSITHKDLDGVTCSILIQHVFENVSFIDCVFGELEQYILSIDFDDWDWVFVTDIYPDKKVNQIYNDKLIMIDHHKSNSFHDPENNLFVNTNYCGCYLVKKYLEKKMKVDLSQYDSLVYYVNDYDIVWPHKTKNSTYFNYLYSWLWSDEFRLRFKDGFTVFRDYEKQFLDYQDKKFNQIYDNLDVSCFSKIKACYFSGQDFINEVCEKLMFEEGFSIVFCYNTRTNRISIRTKEDNIDLGEILKKLDFGGGHPKAAGMNLCSTNLLQERLENIENYMYKHFENVRN